jgi:hypothetical protein
MKSPLPDIGPRDAAMGWVPRDACTLPTTEQPLRAAEFDDLFAASLRDIEHCDARRARLVLAGDHRLPTRLQRLVDAESSCCSFFTFTLTRLDAGASDEPGETVVALTIEVPTARAGVLEALVTRADQARQVTP